MEHQGSNEALRNDTTFRADAAGGAAADRHGYDPDIAAALKASAEYLSTSDRKSLPYGPFASIADMELFLKSHYDRVALGGTVSGQQFASDFASMPAAPSAPDVSTRGSSGACSDSEAPTKQVAGGAPRVMVAGLKGGSLGKSVHSAAILGALGHASHPAQATPPERMMDAVIGRLSNRVSRVLDLVNRIEAVNVRLIGIAPQPKSQGNFARAGDDSEMGRVGILLEDMGDLLDLAEAEICRLETMV
jgi:hypothetical protein